jgi:gluconolactonase
MLGPVLYNRALTMKRPLIGLWLICGIASAALAQEPAKVERLGKGIDDIVPADATIKKVADGFTWTEGPIWIYEGYLLFADIPGNAILKMIPGHKPTVFMHPSGWNEATPYNGKEPGSNGMTLDSRLRLTVAGHARRNVWRLETMNPKGKITVLADRFDGKRLNSPNDLVYKRDHSLYFTDPPYGLQTQSDDDPQKELKVNGVYRLEDAVNHPPGAPPDAAKLHLIVSDLPRPNGLAFSPDEKYLYVDCSDPKKKVWMRYSVQADGTVADPKLILDVSDDPREGAPDGMKVDQKGNIYSTGPGGIWIFSAKLDHIGTIDIPERTANLAWGGQDGKTLYITASGNVYSMRLKIAGVRP